jgi:voltage-gated potassium channel Kch
MSATILVAFHRSQVSKRTSRYATILVVVAAGGSLLGQAVTHTSESRLGTAITSGLVCVLLLASLPAITRKALAHRKVGLNTLAAAVTAYLIIGLFFTGLYRFIAAAEGIQFFEGVTDANGGDFQFFSFVTLTTVGYGDLVPATDGGRAAAVLEALSGQVFLVTAVARIVSIMGRERPEPILYQSRYEIDEDEERSDPDGDQSQ